MLPQEKIQLIEDNMGLAYHFMHVWRTKLLFYKGELEDLESICLLALTKTAKSFDPNKGTKFATLMGTIVRNEIYMALRRNRKYRGFKTLSLHQFFDPTRDHARDSIDFVRAASVHDQSEEFANRELITYLLDEVLNDRERFVIYHRFFEGWTQKDCADYFGTNQSWMSRVERNALKKMRKYIQKQTIIEDRSKKTG